MPASFISSVNPVNKAMAPPWENPARIIQCLAVMLLDKGGHHFTVGGYCLDGSFFVIAHEATVAFDIRAEDRGQFPFHTPSLRPRLS